MNDNYALYCCILITNDSQKNKWKTHNDFIGF